MTRALALALALCAAGAARADDSPLLAAPYDPKPGDVLVVTSHHSLRLMLKPACEADGVRWLARIEKDRITCNLADRPKPNGAAQ